MIGGGVWRSIIALTSRFSVTNSQDGNAASASRITTGNGDTVGLEIKGTASGGTPEAPGSTFFATYSSSIDADSSSGSPTGTAHNGAAVSGAVLNLNGATGKYVSYVGTGNFNQAQVWTFRANVKPNYSGSPATRQYFIERDVGGSLRGYCGIYHDPSGKIRIAYRDDSSTELFEGDVGTWSPTAGTTYEIEWDTDLSTGANRVFINGVQLGSTNTTSGNVGTTANEVLIGQGFDIGHSANFSISNVVVFPTVQHTSNFASEIPRVYTGSQTADLQRWLAPGGATLASVDRDGNLSYTPGDSTDWDGADPTTVTEALDRCAALLKSLNSGTGP